MKAVVVGKLVGEGECTRADLRFDAGEVRARPSEVGLMRDPRQSASKPATLNPKVELDSMGTCGYDSARDRFATHLEPPTLLNSMCVPGIYLSHRPDQHTRHPR